MSLTSATAACLHSAGSVLVTGDNTWEEVFKNMDVDGDGNITKQELLEAWEALRPAKTLDWLDEQCRRHQKQQAKDGFNHQVRHCFNFDAVQPCARTTAKHIQYAWDCCLVFGELRSTGMAL